MDWAGNISDNDSEDGWDALAPGSIDSLPVSDDHKFDERHAVCLGSEIVFDRVLATQDPDMLSRSFKKWMALRRAVELEQACASSHNLDQEFLRLGLVPPVRPPVMSSHGFNLSFQLAYSEFLRQGHGSLGDLIRLQPKF